MRITGQFFHSTLSSRGCYETRMLRENVGERSGSVAKRRHSIARHVRVCVRTLLVIIRWNELCDNPAPKAKHISPARECWEKWEKRFESRRDDRALTHTLKLRPFKAVQFSFSAACEVGPIPIGPTQVFIHWKCTNIFFKPIPQAAPWMRARPHPRIAAHHPARRHQVNVKLGSCCRLATRPATERLVPSELLTTHVAHPPHFLLRDG